MDPINPWLDPSEVRLLAERLMKPATGPMVSLPDAGFDGDFIGFTGAAAPVPAPARGPESRGLTTAPTATPAAPTSSPEPESVPPPPPPPEEDVPVVTGLRGPFLDRIHRFRNWMRASFGASGIFLLDREGEIIFDEGGHGKLHLLARSLATAARRPGTQAENVHVKVGAGATLEVIPVETPYGCLVLGAVVSLPLPPASISQISEALYRVVSPPA
jgi:hypothetical protein